MLQFKHLNPICLDKVTAKSLGHLTVTVNLTQDGMEGTTNRSDVLAVPAFKRQEQKELRGQYNAQAHMSG